MLFAAADQFLTLFPKGRREVFIARGGPIPPQRVFGPWEVTESSEGADFFTKRIMSIAKLIHGEKYIF